jgi:hypothetical protein
MCMYAEAAKIKTLTLTRDNFMTSFLIENLSDPADCLYGFQNNLEFLKANKLEICMANPNQQTAVCAPSYRWTFPL